MTLYLRESLALSTRAAYTSTTCSFTHFCITFHCIYPDGTLLPASEHTLMLFRSVLVRLSSYHRLARAPYALDLHMQASSTASGPLFRLSGETMLMQQQLNVLIEMLAARSGIQPDTCRNSSHSFRIGAASAAAVADWQIQALGRWSSDCYRGYIRLPDSNTSNIAATLARSYL